ncbi:MAG: helix-turn-helix transcriptional regulator [Rhodospirillales bacterium]|nr:helix-turn-helix transcriptional regulator [Rhodospirillales bacterium]
MDIDHAAKCLSELGNPTRLAIFRLLVRAGATGLTVGGIQKRLNVPASTLSHHISHLVWAGLIVQERDGRTLHCHTQPGVMDDLVGFLMDECCKGFDADSDASRAG